MVCAVRNPKPAKHMPGEMPVPHPPVPHRRFGRFNASPTTGLRKRPPLVPLAVFVAFSGHGVHAPARYAVSR